MVSPLNYGRVGSFWFSEKILKGVGAFYVLRVGRGQSNLGAKIR